MIEINPRDKELYREGNTRKHIQIKVYKEDRETVDFSINLNNLVSESFKFDERLCSDDNLKFGLCEGSSVEFQYFGNDLQGHELPNIRGRRIFVEMGPIDHDMVRIPVTPIGFFTVKECSKQASTGIKKVVAYNKLAEDFLDEQESSENIMEIFGTEGTVSVYEIMEKFLPGYMVPFERTALNYTEVGGTSTYVYKTPKVAFPTDYLNSPINRARYNLSEWDTQHDRPYTDTYLYIQPAFVGYDTIYTYHNRRFHQPTRIMAEYGDLEWLENSFKNYVIGVLANSTWCVYTDDIFHHICRTHGFQKLMGVRVNISKPISGGGWQEISNKWYSTVQWEYEETWGDPHTVAGPMSEVYKLFQYPNQDRRYIIDILLPRYISDAATYGSGTLTRIYYDQDLDDTYEWQYKDPDTGTISTETSDLPHPHYNYPWPDTDGAVMTAHGIQFYEYPDMPVLYATEMDVQNIPQFTVREMLTAVYESQCQFGKLDRVTDLFSGVGLLQDGLFPAESLVPDNSLYPNGYTGGAAEGASENVNPALYSKLWADEGDVRTFRNLLISYKTTEIDENQNEQEVEKVVELEVNSDGTDDYIMDDNWLFKSFVWTEDDVTEYGNEMVAKMQGLSWFPFEMWCAGLPYIEAGDQVEIHLRGSSNVYRSYVLRRSLKGIQNLQDEMINGTLDIF